MSPLGVREGKERKMERKKDKNIQRRTERNVKTKVEAIAVLKNSAIIYVKEREREITKERKKIRRKKERDKEATMISIVRANFIVVVCNCFQIFGCFKKSNMSCSTLSCFLRRSFNKG